MNAFPYQNESSAGFMKPLSSISSRTGRSTRRVAFVGTFPPTQCGLATFTRSMVESIAVVDERIEPLVIRLVQPGDIATPSDVAAVDWNIDVPDSVDAVLAVIADREVAALVVQHEYGIFGGPDGSDVIDFLERCKLPTLVVLHTVLANPAPEQHRILRRVVELADVTVVQSEVARRRLSRFEIAPATVEVVPHGAWMAPAKHPRPRNLVPRVLTWGLLGPGKGLEYAIAAMALLDREVHAWSYVIAGETHPKVLAEQGQAYRRSLESQAQRLGVADKVIFDPTYRDTRALADLVHSADVVLLPYDSVDQVTSGVLVEALAAGVPVVATAFPHAVEALATGAGRLVGHGDVEAMARAVQVALTHGGVAVAMRAEAERVGRSLHWSTVAKRYVGLIDRAINHRRTPGARVELEGYRSRGSSAASKVPTWTMPAPTQRSAAP